MSAWSLVVGQERGARSPRATAQLSGVRSEATRPRLGVLGLEEPARDPARGPSLGPGRAPSNFPEAPGAAAALTALHSPSCLPLGGFTRVF